MARDRNQDRHWASGTDKAKHNIYMKSVCEIFKLM